MPSPFPGMTPYLEQKDVWHDFHERLLPHVAEVTGSQLAAHYIVKVDEHFYIHEPSAEQRILKGGGVVAQVDVESNSFLGIRDRRDGRLVTVIEVLSPTNKNCGPYRHQYLDNRRRLLASSTNLVEIDLLRGGPRMLAFGTPPELAYCALVNWMDMGPHSCLWPIRLRDPLPIIPIPLRNPDPDAQLDLQAALNHVYDAARYGNYIYEGTPSRL